MNNPESLPAEELLRRSPIETQMRDAVGRNNPHRSKDALLVEGAKEIEALRENLKSANEACNRWFDECMEMRVTERARS